METFKLVFTLIIFLFFLFFLALKFINQFYVSITNKFIVLRANDNHEEELKSELIKKFRKKLQKSVRRLAILSEIAIITQRVMIFFNRDYLAFTIVGLLLFIFILWILYFIIPSLDLVQNIVRTTGLLFLDFFDIKLNNYTKKLIIDAVEAGTNFVALFISISMTLYFFTIRQRRNISISNLNVIIKNNFTSFLIIIICVFYGKFFSIISKSINDEVFTSFTQYTKVVVWGILFIFSLINAMSIVRFMLKSVNLGFLLEQMCNHISHTTKKLTYSIPNNEKNTWYIRFSNQSKIKIFEYLHDCIESQYQMLSLAINNNLGALYRRNYSQWKNFLTDFMQGYKKNKISAAVPLEKLHDIDPIGFSDYYQSIVENHIALIITLLNNNKLIDAEKALETFFVLEPSHLHENLREIYISNLHELLLNIYLNHDVGFRFALVGLEQFCNSDSLKEKNGGLKIYQDLLFKAVERNDVNQISNLVYSMIKPLDDNQQTNSKNENLKKLLVFLRRYKKNNFIIKYQQSVIFIVLQVLLKSIELSKYSCTGFLIKFMVTNFYSEFPRRSIYLRDTFNYFTQSIREQIDDNPYIDINGAQSRLPVSPNFNRSTMIYCLHKLSILLFGQQRYSETKKLTWRKNNNIFPKMPIDIAYALKDCLYIDYLIKKIEKAKDRYGMIYLDDVEFMNTLKNEIKFYIRKEIQSPNA
jgi:hypothetical protein